MTHSFHLKLLTSILTVLLPLIIIGQSNPGRPATGKNANGEGFGVISGALHDAQTKEHIEYGNIILFRTSDSSMVTGTISGTKGKFLIDKIQPGNYYLKVQFIGYENTLFPNLKISASSVDILLGDIFIKPKASALSTVEITAEKAMITSNLDKKIITVDKNMAIGGGTATDVMENVPSVTVDAEGNVSLRGNSNITLLIDGKPSSQAGIAASDVLNQIPASAIESVEVITNPSVRYDPDGTSGIINIVLKKKALQGFNGMISANAGTGEKYNGSLNLNYRHDHFNLFVNADGRMNQMKTSTDNTRNTTNNDVLNVLIQNQEGTFERNMGSVNAGIDYLMNPRNTLTLSIQRRKMEFGSDGNMRNLSLNGEGLFLRYFERATGNLRSINSNEYTASFKHSFPQKGREFTNDIIISSNRMNNGSLISQQDFTSQEGTAIGNPVLQDNQARNNNKVYTFQGNYTYPMLSGSRIEAGYKATIRDMGMRYEYKNFEDSTQSWESQELLKNYYDYFDQQYAIYGIYANSYKKLKYQAGLRLEQVFTESKVEITQQDYNSAYFQFYPSVHLGYDLGNQKELQLSYSRRIERPSPRELNPYIDYSDSLNIETGNPALKPEFSNSIEFGFSKFWDNSSINSTVFYRSTKDVVEDISRLQENGSTLTMPMNINTASSYGMEWVFSANPFKWIRINSNISFFQSHVSSIPEEDILGTDRFSWTSRLNLSFIPWKDGSFQLIGSYNSPTRSSQEYHKEQYFADASFRQDFLKNKLTFTLRLTDVFNTRTFYESTYGNGFTIDSKRYRESRVLYAGIQLKINNYNKKTAKDGENGEQDGF
ncbi:MAG: TonB-dependent receptor [Bacteroidales bacterium]|nr:TonB-dependent receptor [Bacteroidales bacterium]